MIYIDNLPQMNLIESFLDDNNVPKSDSGQAMYSTYGRVKHWAAQHSAHLTALRRGLAVSILFNVVLLAVALVAIGGR